MKSDVASLLFAAAAGAPMVFGDEIVQNGGIPQEQRIVRVAAGSAYPHGPTQPKFVKKAARAKAKAARKQAAKNRRHR